MARAGAPSSCFSSTLIVSGIPSLPTSFFNPNTPGSYGNGMHGEESDENSELRLMGSSHPYSSSKIDEYRHHSITKHDDGYYSYEREEQPKKVMHHFLDEWTPKDKDSWTNSEDKMPTYRTKLSISIPNSMHDFFVTQK